MQNLLLDFLGARLIRHWGSGDGCLLLFNCVSILRGIEIVIENLQDFVFFNPGLKNTPSQIYWVQIGCKR